MGEIYSHTCYCWPLPIKPKSRESDRLISYFLSLAILPFTAPCKLIWFMKGGENNLEERLLLQTRAREEVKLLPTPSQSRQTMNPGFQMPFLYSLTLYFPFSLKSTFSYWVFLELCSPLWCLRALFLWIFSTGICCLFLTWIWGQLAIEYLILRSQASHGQWRLIHYHSIFFNSGWLQAGQRILKKELVLRTGAPKMMKVGKVLLD